MTSTTPVTINPQAIALPDLTVVQTTLFGLKQFLKHARINRSFRNSKVYSIEVYKDQKTDQYYLVITAKLDGEVYIIGNWPSREDTLKSIGECIEAVTQARIARSGQKYYDTEVQE